MKRMVVGSHILMIPDAWTAFQVDGYVFVRREADRFYRLRELEKKVLAGAKVPLSQSEGMVGLR
jgi:hypothetical protein